MALFKTAIETSAYQPTHAVFRGVSKFFIKLPGLLGPVCPRSRELFVPEKSVVNHSVVNSLVALVAFGEYSNIVENGILTMQRFLDVSRFLYSEAWQVCESKIYVNIV